MKTSFEESFKQDYQRHLKHLALKGLQPKTVDAYSRAIRRIGKYFDCQINDLSEQQSSTLTRIDPLVLRIIDPADARLFVIMGMKPGDIS